MHRPDKAYDSKNINVRLVVIAILYKCRYKRRIQRIHIIQTDNIRSSNQVTSRCYDGQTEVTTILIIYYY